MHRILTHASQYPRPITDAYLQELEAAKEDTNVQEEHAGGEDVPMDASSAPPEIIAKRTGDIDPSSQVDTPDVPPRLSEKRKLSWRGKSCMTLPSS